MSRALQQTQNLSAKPTYAVVRDRIVQEIISGELKSGRSVTTTELCARYGVSLMPVREALQQLQGEGVVELHERRGAWIPEMDEAFVQQQYDIRAAFQSLLTRRCAQNRPDETLDQLRHLNESMRQLGTSQQGEVNEIVRLNSGFHEAITQGAQCAHISRVYRRGTGSYLALTEEWRRKLGMEMRLHMTLCDQHDAIIAAIADRDGERAANLAWEHSRTARENMIELFKQSQSGERNV